MEPELTSTASVKSDPQAGKEGLRVDRVSHVFEDRSHGATEVLKDVSFAIEPGQFVSLMGPSGCGKSTVLTMAAGFLEPTEGSVKWQGEPIQGPDHTRGVVFQKPQLYPWLDVYENVMFGPRALGRERQARDLARELIAEVGLEGFERHSPYQLSGGMQHWVALARTLVNEPALLLMDEPFAALDAQTREEMQALLLDIWQRHQCTVLFVTHDLEEGLLLADRVLIMGHRPGTLRESFEVRFPRPREDSLVFDPEFVEMRGSLREMFRRESK
ncbi:MAG: ABC transporter ATP-binding protein [Solirubrobacterales bacterium]